MSKEESKKLLTSFYRQKEQWRKKTHKSLNLLERSLESGERATELITEALIAGILIGLKKKKKKEIDKFFSSVLSDQNLDAKEREIIDGQFKRWKKERRKS